MADPRHDDRPATSPTFADELRRLREARGLTRKALAGRASLDPSTMTRLENGERGPSREVVDLLVNALRVTLLEEHALLRAAGFLTDEAAELLDEPELARFATLLARDDLAADHRALLLRHLRLGLDLAAVLGYEIREPLGDG